MSIPLPRQLRLPDAALLGGADDAPGGGLWRGAWRRLRRNPTAIAAR